jgi:nicotinamide mononucleotide adenylyltransferase
MPRNPTTYIDADGAHVPAKYVREYDKLRDRIARRILADWQAEEKRLRKVKADTLAAIDRLREAAAAETGVPDRGGRQGTIQVRSFDGTITVSVDAARRTEFDERLGIAQRLILEAVGDMTADTQSADLVEIATKAFQPRRNGNLDMQRIRDLKSYKVTHPKWVKACEIISECERVVGHRRYIRVSVRRAADAEPENLVLDIAAV